MTFLRSFHALTFATALWAFLALVSTGQLHIPAIVAFLAFFMLAAMRRRIGLRIPGLAWIAITLAAFAAGLYGWFVMGERLYSVTYFFLFLELNKLMTASKNRDYLQIYCLTFFQILAAAVSTESVLFAPVLAIYVFLVIAGMMTFTIKRDAEAVFASGRRGGRDAPEPAAHPVLLPRGEETLARIAVAPYLDRRLGAWLAVFTAIVLVVGSLVFWIVPRTASPNLFAGLSGRDRGTAMSAFSDSIDFTGVNEVQTDPTIVMRAAPLINNIDERPQFLRIRGTALDYFSGRDWSKSPRLQTAVTSTRDNIVTFIRPAVPAVAPLAVRFTLEAENSGYFFTVDQPASVSFSDLQSVDVDHEAQSVKALMPRNQAIGYVSVGMPSQARPAGPSNRLLSQLAAPAGGGGAPAVLRETAHRMGEFRRGLRQLFGLGSRGRRGLGAEPNYLQTPRIADMRVLADTARQWTEGAASEAERASRIEERFHSEYGYTLDIGFSRREDHLAYFLAEAREGHCEYFATAMALMLRSLGIPARVVNGYMTDEWSQSARRYIVRQEHAHTWVEARLDDTGLWYTFDPTPTSGIGSNRIPHTFYHGFSRWLDALKVFWYEKYIDFDLEDQRGGMMAFLRTLRFGHQQAVGGFRGLRNFWRGETELPLTGRQLLGVSLLAAGVFGAGLLSLKMRSRQAPSKGAARRNGMAYPQRVRDYVALLNDLQRLRPRAPAQTPMAYAAALTKETGGRLEPFRVLTSRYYDVRYAAGAWGPELDALARQVREALPELRLRVQHPSPEE